MTDQLVRKRHSHFPWHKPCAGNPEFKELFHAEAKTRLLLLASYMEWSPRSYELTYDPQDWRLSGETVLHHDTIRIVVIQTFWSRGLIMLLRACKNRVPFGGNYAARVRSIENIPDFAQRVREVRGEIPLRRRSPLLRRFDHPWYWKQFETYYANQGELVPLRNAKENYLSGHGPIGIWPKGMKKGRFK